MLSIWLRVATALSEIVVGTIAQLIIGAAIGAAVLGTQEAWVTFLSGTGAIVLTFLAGAELDPVILTRRMEGSDGRRHRRFRRAVPRLCGGGALSAGLGAGRAGWPASHFDDFRGGGLRGDARNRPQQDGIWQDVLAACFINDLLTVLALGLIFAPFTFKTLIFGGRFDPGLHCLPWLTPRFFKRFGGRPSELEAKYLFLCLFGLGALAAWAQSEAVLPAYVVGMVLAGTVGKDHSLVRRLRTLTFGFLTPFYFIRAGSFVSVPALWAAPIAFALLFGAKVLTKTMTVYPVDANPREDKRETAYTTLLMSTGLTFGTISSLFGLTHHIIDQAQYSLLVAAVIGSAVIPTLIANAFYLPHHLLYGEDDIELEREGAGLGDVLFDNGGERE